MHFLTIDFETYYCSTKKAKALGVEPYTLRSMMTQEYVYDPRFKAFGASFKFYGQPSYWVPGDQLEAHLEALGRSHGWDHITVIGHNLRFDGLILSHHYGVVPVRYIDTLGMSRAVIGALLNSHGLDEVLKYLGRPGKTGGGEALAAVDGVRNPTPQQMANLAHYALGDADGAEFIFVSLSPTFPIAEYDMLDAVTRMAADPKLELDRDIILRCIEEEEERVLATLTTAQQYIPALNPTALRSGPKFAAIWGQMLAQYLPRASVPTKFSKTAKNSDGTAKVSFAFAKDDKQFFAQAQLMGDAGKALYKAKLAYASSINLTRLKRFLRLADSGGKLAVPLNYSGALNTHRLSGADKLNMQNMPRVNQDDWGVDMWTLRHCIKAPRGSQIVVVDSSGIEFVVAMTLAGQFDVLDRRKKGIREYSEFATEVFGRPIDKKKDPVEDLIGKVGVLQLQYQSGANGFARSLFSWTASMPDPIIYNEMQSKNVVDTYRRRYAEVVKFWNALRHVLDQMVRGEKPVMNCPQRVPVEWESDGFTLPSGLKVKYPNLKRTQVEYTDPKDGKVKWQNAITYTDVRKKGARTKLYPGKLFENLCIAGGEKVLQPGGWVAIEKADPLRPVWDGIEWVLFDKIAYQGKKEVISFCGVGMTPDHEVLTHDGWQEASQISRHDRVPCRLPRAFGVSRVGRTEQLVARALSWMRGHPCDRGVGSEKAEEQGREGVVRVSAEEVDRRPHPTSRYGATPRVRDMALNARPMHAQDALRLPSIWRTGCNAMRQVARLLGVLGGHGSALCDGALAGADGQRERVLSRELPMAYTTPPSEQQAQQPHGRNSDGHDDDHASCAAVQDRLLHAPLSGDADKHDARRVSKTYDLVNAGPRSQFVVLGDDGPFIVHNCQALASEVVDEQLMKVRAKYNSLVLQVHDEGGFCVLDKDAEACYQLALAEFSKPPAWWPELDVGSDGDYAPSYGDAK